MSTPPIRCARQSADSGCRFPVDGICARRLRTATDERTIGVGGMTEAGSGHLHIAPIVLCHHSKVCASSHKAKILTQPHPNLYPSGNSLIEARSKFVSATRRGYAPHPTTKVPGRTDCALSLAHILPASRGTSNNCSPVHTGFVRPA